MKTFHWLLVLSFLPFIASAQSASRPAKLVGIVSYAGNWAILQVPETNGYFEQTKQFILGPKQSENGIKIQDIDVTNGIVTAVVDGESRALGFDESDNSKSAAKPATIRLRDVKLQPLINFYIAAKGRTILQHPKLEQGVFTLTANPQSKSEAAKAFEELFASRKIAAIPDGDKFVLLVPYAFTNRVMPRSSEFEEPGPVMQPLSINFQGVPLDKVLEVYAAYLGRWAEKEPRIPYSGDQSFFIYFYQANSLSKGQICYAFQTIFAWRDFRVVTNKDNTIGWEKIP